MHSSQTFHCFRLCPKWAIQVVRVEKCPWTTTKLDLHPCTSTMRLSHLTAKKEQKRRQKFMNKCLRTIAKRPSKFHNNFLFNDTPNSTTKNNVTNTTWCDRIRPRLTRVNTARSKTSFWIFRFILRALCCPREHQVIVVSIICACSFTNVLLSCTVARVMETVPPAVA